MVAVGSRVLGRGIAVFSCAAGFSILADVAGANAMADEAVLLLCMGCVSGFAIFGCRCDTAAEDAMAGQDCRGLEAVSPPCRFCASGLDAHSSDIGVVFEEDARKLRVGIVALPALIVCASWSN